MPRSAGWATWFDTFFFRDVTERLLGERMIKRIVTKGAPDAKVLREAMKAAVEYLDYTDYLLGRHNWMAGSTLSLADLAAAAQISVVDYLGGIDWRSHEADQALVFGDEEPARVSAHC